MEKLQGKVPQVRFPEFKDVWEQKRLGDIAKFSKGKGITKADIIENGNIECIRYGELYTKYGDSITEIYSRTNIGLKNLLLSETNDVIIPASGESQLDIAKASCVLKSGVALGGDLNIIKSENDGIFLSLYLNSKKKIDIANLAQGISVIHLYSSQLATLNLNLPTIPEQKRIASFFTVLDKKIAVQTHYIAFLRQYKKGVMQKLFSQELRFKDENGKEFPKWEKLNFGKIYSFKITNSLSRDKFNYETGTVKNIHYGDIHTKYKTLFDVANEIVPFINLDIKLERIDKENYCQIGDLVIADASEDYSDIGKAIEVINLENEKILAGLHTILARPDKNTVSIGFGGYLMGIDYVQLQIRKIAQGTKVLGLSSKKLSDIIINLPSKPEQTKIVDFITSIDNKIHRTENQLQQTQQYKKGLLQNMFI